MIRAFLVAALLVLAGCSTFDGGSGPEIAAPGDMKYEIHGHLNAIYDCWVASGVPNVKQNHNDLRVKLVPATGAYQGVPTFVYDNKQVGGVYMGSCGGGGSIQLAANGTAYNSTVLKHELCHHMDMQGPCLGGHPDIFKQSGCCPYWPYIGSRALTACTVTDVPFGQVETRAAYDKGLIIVSVFRRFEDDLVMDVLIFDERPIGPSTAQLSNLVDDITAGAVAVEWWDGLRKRIGE